jgi:hypothetical protein
MKAEELAELKTRIMTRLGNPKGTDDCWTWPGAKSRSRPGIYYPTLSLHNKSLRVHRVTFRIWVGPLVDGMHIDHLCRNTLCVNPWHLEQVTERENIIRGVGPTAVNAKKEVCINGHPFSPKYGTTYRQCATCQNIFSRDFKRRKRAAAKSTWPSRREQT